MGPFYFSILNADAGLRRPFINLANYINPVNPLVNLPSGRPVLHKLGYHIPPKSLPLPSPQ